LRPVTVERQQGMAPFRIIKVVSDVLETITLYVCSFLVFAMFLVVMVQVISRVLGSSVPWTEEISRYLLIWIG
jgi:TRAP-type C4-dicarboxylate transport system permease small subunit